MKPGKVLVILTLRTDIKTKTLGSKKIWQNVINLSREKTPNPISELCEVVKVDAIKLKE